MHGKKTYDTKLYRRSAISVSGDQASDNTTKKNSKKLKVKSSKMHQIGEII